MKKTTFLKKLESTKITKENTVEEARAAQRTKKSLENYLRKAAATYILENEGEDLNAPGQWITVKYEFNLSPTGSVAVRVFSFDSPMVPEKELRRYSVPKRNLFT